MGYIRDWQTHEPSPAITLKGGWVTGFGFSTGHKIEVIPEAGQLIIRLADQ